jgi:hypothetical protein
LWEKVRRAIIDAVEQGDRAMSSVLLISVLAVCGILGIDHAEIGPHAEGHARLAPSVEEPALPPRPRLDPEQVVPEERLAAIALDGVGARIVVNRDGHVQSVALEGNTITDARASRLASFPELARLSLDARRLTAVGVRPLLALPKLRELSISGLDERYLGLVAQLRGVESLGFGGEPTARGIRALRPMPNLKSLSLRMWGSGEEAVDTMREVANLGALRHLCLSGKLVVEAVAELRGSRIERLTLGGYGMPSDEALEKIGQISTVQRLDFGEQANTQWTDQRLEKVQGLRNLRYLNLFEARVTDAGMAHVARMSGMERLNLCRTRVGDAGVAHLRGLKSLKELRLESTRVTDAGLASLAAMPALKVLWLGDTGVTDAGMPIIARAPSLADLRLTPTAVTDAGARALAALRRGASVHLPEGVTLAARQSLHDRGITTYGGATPRPWAGSAPRARPGDPPELPAWARPDPAGNAPPPHPQPR